MKHFDKYSLVARQLPGMIALIPFWLLLTAVWPDKTVTNIIVGLCTTFGLSVLGQQFVRDLGKKGELKLFSLWGAKPTTAILRHNLNPLLDSQTLQRYHDKLSKIVPIEMPTAEDEERDSLEADKVYDSCTRFLMENTRDEKKFKLVFAENINYGFRRNLWALKSVGMVCSFTSIIASSILLYIHKVDVSFVIAAVFTINMLLLLTWIFFITPHWVRRVAEEYAKHLVSACDSLKAKK